MILHLCIVCFGGRCRRNSHRLRRYYYDYTLSKCLHWVLYIDGMLDCIVFYHPDDCGSLILSYIRNIPMCHSDIRYYIAVFLPRMIPHLCIVCFAGPCRRMSHRLRRYYCCCIAWNRVWRRILLRCNVFCHPCCLHKIHPSNNRCLVSMILRSLHIQMKGQRWQWWSSLKMEEGWI